MSLTENQLDMAFYVMLTLAFIGALVVMNITFRSVVKASKSLFSHSENLSISVKTARKNDMSKSKAKAVPIVHPDDQLEFADQLPDLDEQVVDALRNAMNIESPDSLVMEKASPDLRILDLAKPKQKGINKAKKPMAVRTRSTRITNVPEQLTEEAICLLETPAFQRYPVNRFPFKQKNKRRNAINAFVENLPRVAVM